MDHYLCERCGGTGVQEAGCYNPRTGKYDAPAGVCDDCDGGGLLGPVRRPDHAGPTYGEKALGCFVATAAVLSVAVTLLILGDYILEAIRANGPANWGW